MKTALLFLVASFILFTSGASRADIEDTIEESFDVAEGGRLTVDSDLGSIEVSAIPGNTVEITVIRTVDTDSRERADKILEDLEISFEQQGNDVMVTARYQRPESFLKRLRQPLRLQYHIKVPRVYNLDLKTSGGSISVDDLQGEVKSRTSGGSLKFGDIDGSVWGRTSGGSISLDGCGDQVDVKTSGGSITVGRVKGPVQANTSGGSIKIDSVEGDVVAETSGGSISVAEVMGNINAGTSGGSVTAHLLQPLTADCRLTTSGGSVNVYLDDDIKADIDAETSGGRVHSELDIDARMPENRRSLRGELNGGGPELYLRTSGGNIYLKKL